MCEEILAIYLGLTTFVEELSERKVVLFSDNKGVSLTHRVASKARSFLCAGAEHATSRGSARAFDHNQVIHEVWSLCFQYRIDLWIDRVASKFNISDSPSRGEHEIMNDLGAVWRPPIWSDLSIPSCV